MYSPYHDRVLLCRVSTFGNLRVNGYLLLTAAYRSLSRPSSAPSARASTLRSFCLTALTLPLAYGRQALLGSLFPLLTVSCQFDVFLSNASSFDESFLIRYSVFMVPRLSLPYRPRETCTPLSSSAFETLSILKKKFARQPPAFPWPHAIVSSAGQFFTVVFGMGTGVSSDRITTGQLFFLFTFPNKELTHRPLLLP